jgi:acetyl-CoA C-acetyltransferase
MESMSNVPFYVDSLRWGNKYGNTSLIDGLAKDGLTDVYDGKAMGNAAEKCATECGITREQQDAFAIESYKRSQAAVQSGKFEAEIVPVPIPQKKGDPILFAKDEEPFNVKFEKIPELKGAFIKDGTVTAANASTMNDGAAALVLMSKEKADKLGLKPIAKVKAYADAEQAPEWFTTTPALAVPKAVAKAGLQMSDISFWELNEAFSVVGIENTKRLNIDPAKVNVNGGAVSLGHPLGCSGARIIVTLIHILHQNNAQYGAAGICNGGGGASAMVVEKV